MYELDSRKGTKKISKLEDKIIEITQLKNRKKIYGKKIYRASGTCETTKDLTFVSLGSQRERKESRLKKVFKETIAENCLILARDINIQNQADKQISNRLNPKKSTPKHMIFSLLKIHNEEKTLERNQRKMTS